MIDSRCNSIQTRIFTVKETVSDISMIIFSAVDMIFFLVIGTGSHVFIPVFVSEVQSF